ncbi:MAG: sigma-70 family RNA polymerase sigma factor [Paludisphaera borealis]|uniref:sigma-70 family RNA polymerase sigma factor n=1 Tax=Paludisphaera borealis TaxID=1387353 RepID=UPI00284DEFDC|nr:sigma-70 family RNA polymerase sigma factor [Paludisphaera borealis]MDR3622697.1 sigma-70 family RNA polymerase sigma factor [Paludisphaera borealis]
MMMRLKSANLVRDFGALFGSGTLAGMGDGLLLERFVAHRDEVAFEELMVRHGPMVLGICRRWLEDPRDVEDAFQATFLILVRKSATLRNRDAFSSWLYGVTLRVVRRARANVARRRAREQPFAEEPAGRGGASECSGQEVFPIVDEEIRRLPEKQQVAAILCLRQGYTHEAAASELGWPLGTLKSRIAAARQTLIRRLTRRGVNPSSMVAVLRPMPWLGGRSGPLPPQLVLSTLQAVRESLADSGVATASAVGLVREVLRIMFVTRAGSAALLVGTIGTMAWAVPTLWNSRPAGGAALIEAGPAAARSVEAPPPSPPGTDRYGDPLPPGAAMRLGTVRFRQAPSIQRIVYSPGGQRVATGNGESRIQIHDARDGKNPREIDAGIEGVRDFAFSPDGTEIAAVGFRLEPKRNAVVNHLIFTDAATGRSVRRNEWDDQQNVEKAVYAPDGKTLATVSLDGTIRIWDVATAKVQRQKRLIGEGMLTPESIAFAGDADGRLLAIVGRDSIDLWDVARLSRVRGIAIEGRFRPDSLVFSPDGITLAAGEATQGAEIRLWRVKDGAMTGRFKSRKEGHVSWMAFSPDGKVLAAIGSGGPLMCFDAATGKELELLSGVRLMDGPLVFSPDGKTLASTGDRQTLHFWELTTGQDRLATLDAHLGDLTVLACLGDGKTIISGSRDRTVRLWDVATGRPTGMLPHESWIDSLSVSADGSLLATGSAYPEQGKVNLWNLKNGERVHTWSVEGTKTEPHLLRGMTLGGDDSSVIAALSDGTLRCWDRLSGKERPIAQPKLEKTPRTGMGGLDEVDRAVFSRDGRSVAFIGEGWAQVADLTSGERRFKAPSATQACEFAPDGRSLAMVREAHRKGFQAGSWRGSSTPTSTIVWLDSVTGDVRREIDIPQAYVRSLAFSPDGRSIAAGTFSTHPARGIIRIFRLRDKKELQAIETPCPWMQGLCFTPEGKRIFAGFGDTSIVSWDLRPTD